MGIRELAAGRGANVRSLTVEAAFEVFDDKTANDNRAQHVQLAKYPTSYLNALGSGNALFAFPAQSNFSGYRYPLEWIAKAQAGCLEPAQQWYVLLDAAAFVPTSPLDLGVYSPDFVTMSFYKIFGFPTGLGESLGI